MVRSNQSAHFLSKYMVLACMLVVSVTSQTLVWSDEFNSTTRTKPDDRYWTYAVGDGSNTSNPGWGNNELQYYTDSDENVFVDGNGHLVMVAKKEIKPKHQCYYGDCQYTSGRLFTKLAKRYGRFEARLKTPAGKGFWPAFWMLGHDIDDVGWPNCGEIDIMELRGSRPSTVSGALHGPGYDGGRSISHSYTLPHNQSFGDDFHVFAIDWLPDSITWSVDGFAYSTRRPADLGTKLWVFDRPFYILLNFAIGGHFDGNPNPDTEFPQSFLIDYVRVYDLSGHPNDTINTGSQSTMEMSKNCAVYQTVSKIQWFLMFLISALTRQLVTHSK